MRLALVEDEPTRSTLQLAQPIERVLRETPGCALLDVESVPVYFGGADWRFRLPPPSDGAEAPPDDSTAAVLEGDSEVAFVFPADPSLVDALTAAAADPMTYRIPDSVRLLPGDAEFSSFNGPDGEVLLNLRARLERPATGRVRAGIAAYYRLRWKDKKVSVAVVGRTYGGLGRVGGAAQALMEKGPFTGLSRGGAFGAPSSDAHGRAVLEALEKAGLKYAAVSGSEIEHFEHVRAYRAERPDGVRFLSANLVYSTAPHSTAVDPYAVFEDSGARVAVVGLTPQWTERLLKNAGLANLKVLDPVSTLEHLVPELRSKADVVLVLSEVSTADQARLATVARGIDLVLGDDASFVSRTPPPATVVEQDDRPVFANAFPVVRAYSPALNVLDVERTPDGDRVDWRVRQSAVLLDDSVNPAEGFPEPSLEMYAASASTVTPLLPDARAVFKPGEKAAGFPLYESRDFWTLSSALLAECAKAEASVLLSPALTVQGVGGVREAWVRDWLGPNDPAVTVTVPGARLRSLYEEAQAQARTEAEGKSLGGRPRFVVGGVDAQGRVRGAAIDANNVYLVATSSATADALGLPDPRRPVPGGPGVGPAVVDELKSRAGKTPPSDYRAWIGGAPLSEPGLWRINFRDVGLTLRQTKVVRSNDFDPVPNSRVQGFDELLIGGVFKVDAEYLKREYKWTNTAESEYAKSKINPRNAPETTNLAANRLMLLTLATRRAGGIRQEWLARSWGPSLGFQYDGEWEASPGTKRKQAYSMFPGVEFFDGTFIRSLDLSGILKRDLGRQPPNTQTGVRLRAVYEKGVGPGGALLQGELWNNYFFLSKQDAPGDLRMEGGFTSRLRMPIRKHLSLAPYFEYYWFALKTKPRWGYSMTMGVSLGFSRLWKPQYEDF